ncbi:MAG: radical SAM family heme chaperone HemW, partial [Peptostreptococcaceae bacterium]
GLLLQDFKDEFNIDFVDKYKEQIKKLKKQELIEINDENVFLTQKGREISNSIFVEFMN